MKYKGRIRAIMAALGMMVLILDSKTALVGAREGLELCIRTVIPSLFPFFVMSGLLVSCLSGRRISLLRPIGRLTGIPAGAESILLTGLLGGYPVGAGCIGSAVRSGQLSSHDGARMIAFCNNAGPSFLFGIAATLFPSYRMAWALWGIHIVSSLLTGWLLPGKSWESTRMVASKPATLPQSLAAALKTMASVCGWVILFRILLTFLNRWVLWLLPKETVILLTGFLELTNGCCDLIKVDNVGLRFILCSAFLAFGGICVGMQTMSMADNVDMRFYFPGKLIQTAFSTMLAVLVQQLFRDCLEWMDALPWVLFSVGLLLLFLLFRFKTQKSSSIPAGVGV